MPKITEPRITGKWRKPTLRASFRSSTVLTMALMLGAGALGAAAVITVTTGGAAHANACAANPCAANPCAATCAANPCAADPCAANPCAADPCAANPCAANPCAANPCAANPCAADPCAANPCAAGGGASTGCYVPRLQQAAANPCAACAADPCAACAPCAANPCAATCAAANPCAANPCAADPCAACAPCAANPCAANPCAANPCAANPCAAAAAPPEVSDEELQALYACLMEAMDRQAAASGGDSNLMLASWSLSERTEGSDFGNWTNFATTPYISFTHGERFATNHANAIAAEAYGRYEAIGEMPAGGIVAKPTFSIGASGEAFWETLFLMEKAEAGTSPDTNDWIYTAIMPDGSLMGRTLGANSDGMYFCAACHMAMGAESDDLIFLPEEYRLRN